MFVGWLAPHTLLSPLSLSFHVYPSYNEFNDTLTTSSTQLIRRWWKKEILTNKVGITAQFPDFVELEAVRIFNDPNIISMAPMGGERECYKPVLILRNSPTNCLASFNRTLNILPNGTEVATYNIIELGCPAEVVGATRIECNGCDELTANTAACPSVHYCWALNPSTKKLVLLNQNGIVSSLYSFSFMEYWLYFAGTFFRQVDLPTYGITEPYTFTVQHDFQGRHQTYMLIGSYNAGLDATTIWLSTWYISGYTSKLVNFFTAKFLPSHHYSDPPTQHGTITGYDNFTFIPADISGKVLSLHFLQDENYLVAKQGAQALDYYEFYSRMFRN